MKPLQPRTIYLLIPRQPPVHDRYDGFVATTNASVMNLPDNRHILNAFELVEPKVQDITALSDYKHEVFRDDTTLILCKEIVPISPKSSPTARRK